MTASLSQVSADVAGPSGRSVGITTLTVTGCCVGILTVTLTGIGVLVGFGLVIESRPVIELPPVGVSNNSIPASGPGKLPPEKAAKVPSIGKAERTQSPMTNRKPQSDRKDPISKPPPTIASLRHGRKGSGDFFQSRYSIVHKFCRRRFACQV